MINKKKNTKETKAIKSARPSRYGRPVASKRRSAKNRRVRQRNRRVAMSVFALLFICFLIMRGVGCGHGEDVQNRQSIAEQTESGPGQWQKEGAPYIDVQLLTPNSYSRPQLPLPEVRYIAIHYTANPGSTAMDNRNYFENLGETHETKVSSHFVIGLEGEVVQCIPTAELAYATNERNTDTVAIECCHPDDTGAFNQATYDSAVKLAAWLCTRFGLTEENVIRHYDVTGKICPKYYVDNPDAWEQLKKDIGVQIQEDYVLQENQGD